MTTKEYSEPLTEIGGYFGLDLPDYGELYHDSIKFQSGRAAIRAVLECNEITHVMMPAYICDSVIKSAIDAGVTVETYELDELLYPKNLPRRIPDQCAVIYVNYFGLCQQNISRLLKEIPKEQLIIDNSQALFASHSGTLATIYSPRKFAGLPDGGLLKASPLLGITPPTEEDSGSFDRMRFLLTRMAYSAREGYADSHKARNSLKDNYPLSMSRLTQRLMKSIRWDQIIKLRRDNYTVMALMLDAINEKPWTLREYDVPLCYPFTLSGCDINKTKKDLAALNVFTPTYWPGALRRIKANTIEETFLNQTLFLPIDQRLRRAQVEAVSKLVLQLTG